MERTMLMIMKATEIRLHAVQKQEVVWINPQGEKMVPVVEVEKIRADLFLAILELESKVK